MGEVFKALSFVALGMAIAEVYNLRAWHKYFDGRRGK